MGEKVVILGKKDSFSPKGACVRVSISLISLTLPLRSCSRLAMLLLVLNMGGWGQQSRCQEKSVRLLLNEGSLCLVSLERLKGLLVVLRGSVIWFIGTKGRLVHIRFSCFMHLVNTFHGIISLLMKEADAIKW